MQYSNIHTHTTFSDGAHTMEENIQSALEKHMLSLGFSDHSDTACDPSYCMHLEQYNAYYESICRLREKYRDRLPIYIGLELDGFSDVKPDWLDYVIASVHYIIRDGNCYPIDHTPELQKLCIARSFGGQVLEMARWYYDRVVEHVRRTSPTLVGHFDVINKFSLMPDTTEEYQKIAGDALEAAVQYCPYVEVNTGAISRGWRKEPYPQEFLLRRLKKAGGHPVLSSDSHNRDNLIYFFDESVEILKRVGFDHICEFDGQGYRSRKI